MTTRALGKPRAGTESSLSNRSLSSSWSGETCTGGSGEFSTFMDIGSVEADYRSACSKSPCSPRTRSRSESGTWSRSTGASASTNVMPALRVQLVLEPAVDDDDVTRPQRLRLVPDRHRHVTLDDPHHLLGCRVRVPRHRRARLVDDVAEHHLLAADRVDRHSREEGVAIHAVPGPEGRGQAGTSNRIPPVETAFTESSSSKTTFLPSRVGSALASKARSTRSGVIGSSVIQTPTAS